jgi:hypothetical protein
MLFISAIVDGTQHAKCKARFFLSGGDKKKVMNRKKIENKKMDELLKISISGSTRQILRRLREIDQDG